MIDNNRQLLGCAGYMALLALHIALIWYFPYFPTQDGPSHLYNLVILEDLMNGGQEWGYFFDYELRAIPNLGFTLFAYPLLKLFSPLTVEKFFLSFYVLTLGLSVPLFIKTFDNKLIPRAFLVFPIIFNFSLLMGFYSYIIAVPIFLIFFSISFKIWDSALLFKAFVFNLMGIILYYFHLIPFAFYLISLLAISLAYGYEIKFKSNVLRVTKLILAISPLIVKLSFHIINTEGGFPDASYIYSIDNYIERLSDLVLFSSVNFSILQILSVLPFSSVNFSILQILSILPFLFLIFIFGYSSLKEGINRNLSKRTMIVSHRTLLYFSFFIFLIYMFAPFRFGEGSFFNQRLPWVMLILILPLLKIPETLFWRRFGLFSIAAVACLFLIVKVFVFSEQNDKIEEFLSGLNAKIPKGSMVIPYKTKWPEFSNVDVLANAASYYGIFNHCIDLSNYEAQSDFFLVKFNENIPKIPSHDTITYDPHSITWKNYPDIEYLLGWEVDDRDENKIKNYYQKILENKRLSIWKRKNID